MQTLLAFALSCRDLPKGDIRVRAALRPELALNGRSAPQAGPGHVRRKEFTCVFAAVQQVLATTCWLLLGELPNIDVAVRGTVAAGKRMARRYLGDTNDGTC